MLKVKDLPVLERPRERLVRVGTNGLSLIELLQIVLSQGNKEQNITKISEEIISKFGSLRGIYAGSLNELKAIKGIGQVKAVQLKACFELGKRLVETGSKTNSTSAILNSLDAFRIAKKYLGNKPKEYLLLFCLDVRGNMVAEPEVISVGTLDSSLIHPREVFSLAIKNLSARVLLAHNHPSGKSQPSSADISVTRQIYEAGKIMGIGLVDHIIAGDDEFCSIAETNPEVFYA